jgi:heterodisulfide reductase subunit C
VSAATIDPTTVTVDPDFAVAVTTSPEFNAWACLNCGVCTAVCPMEFDVLPRKLFRYAVLGMKEEVLAHTDTIFQCLLCRACEENCMAGVHIAGNVRFLRSYIGREVFGLNGHETKEKRHAAADR